MMIYTITLDTEEPDAERKIKNLLNAEGMAHKIDTYHETVFHRYKYHELTKEAQELLEEIKENLAGHFSPFLD